MLKIYRFKCCLCGHIFEDMVEGEKGQPEECPSCGAYHEEHIKLPTAPNIPPPIDWNK